MTVPSRMGQIVGLSLRLIDFPGSSLYYARRITHSIVSGGSCAEPVRNKFGSLPVQKDNISK